MDDTAAIFSTTLNPHADLQIGRDRWWNGSWIVSNYFDGLIDEMRIYDRALSACEIQALADDPCTIEASVDIKPGSDPNSINLKSKGVLPVAILTTDDFDAADVDGATVTFEGASPVHGEGHLEDVDGNGDLDWIAHFRTQETGLDENSLDGAVEGSTIGGTPIQGSDSVKITPGSSEGEK